MQKRIFIPLPLANCVPISIPDPLFAHISFLSLLRQSNSMILSANHLSQIDYVPSYWFSKLRTVAKRLGLNYLYPTYRGSLYSNNDDFMFFQRAKLFPTSGALSLLFPLPGVHFPQAAHS